MKSLILPLIVVIISFLFRNKEKNINNKKKEKIIKEYIKKTVKHGKRQKRIKKLYKKNGIKEAPTVYVNGEKVEDPYKYSEYKKLLVYLIYSFLLT